jgi:tetratricopeptide (TPR) repeat protein
LNTAALDAPKKNEKGCFGVAAEAGAAKGLPHDGRAAVGSLPDSPGGGASLPRDLSRQRLSDYNSGVSGPNFSGRISMKPWARLAIPGALIVLFVFVAYLPALHDGFIWDDDAYVTHNLTLHDGEGLRQIWFMPGATPQYYPLSFTSFWVDYHLWKLNPLGYHLTNILFQAINAVLLWSLLRRLSVPGAWLAAAIFAVHPVQVESVAWVTERKNVLAGFFYLSSALACLQFWLPNTVAVDSRKRDGVQTATVGFGRWKFYWLALFLYLCALLAKTAAIALPVAVLLVVWWKRGKVGWRELFPMAPFLGVGMAMGLFTVWVEKHFVQAVGSEWTFSFLERCLIAGQAVWFYLGKLLWPHPLIFIYPRWGIDASRPTAYLPVLAVGVALFLLWLKRRGRGGPVFFALAYFVVSLFPVLGFFNVYFFRYSFVADHFQYLADIGPLTLAAAGIAIAFKTKPFLKPACGGALLLTLGLLTWRQAGMYTDTETLWRDTLAKNPDCSIAHNNLGRLLDHQEHIEEAMEHYHKALQLDPNNYEALYNLGNTLTAQGQFDEAIENYRQAIELNPNYYGALDNLGVALANKGRFDEAIENFRKAIQINPNYSDALNNLAWVLAASPDDELRNGAEAVRLAERACELTHYGEPLFIGTLAVAYAECGRYPEAVATAEKAEQLATAAGLKKLAEENRQLLEFYRAGKPYHESPPAASSSLQTPAPRPEQ